jgi:penicillin-binding protein-related factor A (putative recombinase)
MSKYTNVISGFILDFRLSGLTYFCEIEKFIYMTEHLNKKSFNESDLLQWCNPIIIEKRKLKVNYRYNIEKFIEDTQKNVFK